MLFSDTMSNNSGCFYFVFLIPVTMGQVPEKVVNSTLKTLLLVSHLIAKNHNEQFLMKQCDEENVRKQFFRCSSQDKYAALFTRAANIFTECKIFIGALSSKNIIHVMHLYWPEPEPKIYDNWATPFSLGMFTCVCTSEEESEH